MKNLFESILDDFEDLEKSQDKELVKEWFEKNVKGKYKIVVLKNKTVKVRGDILIKDYKEDNFPYTISFMAGNVSIEKCPNITSINGLFTDLMTIEGNLTINNCPKLTSLEGCPMIVRGSLSLTGNSSLKSLEGAPEIVHGTTYVMKNGKKFSKEQIEKHVKMPMRIVCSIEDEEVLVEGLVNEALNEPHLLELVDRMKACKMDVKTLLFNWVEIEWDTIDSSNVTEYNKVDNKVLTICRNILSGRGDRGIILLRNPQDEYQYIISYRKDILVITDYSQNRWSRSWIDTTTTELIEYIKKADSVVVITWDSDTMRRRVQKRVSRGEARQGMVQNTPEYYEQVAQENRARYKKILAQNRANGSDKDFEKIDKDIDAILTKVMQLTRDLRKNFKPNNTGTSYHFDISKIEELNKQIYDQRQWNGGNSRHGGYYSGEHGLLVLYNYYTTYMLRVKNNGDTYYEREARNYKAQLLQKIKDLKAELGI